MLTKRYFNSYCSLLITMVCTFVVGCSRSTDVTSSPGGIGINRSDDGLAYVTIQDELKLSRNKMADVCGLEKQYYGHFDIVSYKLPECDVSSYERSHKQREEVKRHLGLLNHYIQLHHKKNNWLSIEFDPFIETEVAEKKYFEKTLDRIETLQADMGQIRSDRQALLESAEAFAQENEERVFKELQCTKSVSQQNVVEILCESMPEVNWDNYKDHDSRQENIQETIKAYRKYRDMFATYPLNRTEKYVYLTNIVKELEDFSKEYSQYWTNILIEDVLKSVKRIESKVERLDRKISIFYGTHFFNYLSELALRGIISSRTLSDVVRVHDDISRFEQFFDHNQDLFKTKLYETIILDYQGGFKKYDDSVFSLHPDIVDFTVKMPLHGTVEEWELFLQSVENRHGTKHQEQLLKVERLEEKFKEYDAYMTREEFPVSTNFDLRRPIDETLDRKILKIDQFLSWLQTVMDRNLQAHKEKYSEQFTGKERIHILREATTTVIRVSDENDLYIYFLFAWSPSAAEGELKYWLKTFKTPNS